MALAGWIVWPSSPPDPACTADSNLRVEVGGQLFSVPRGYLPGIFDYKGKLVGSATSICQRPKDPAIEAGQFFIPAYDPYIKRDALTAFIQGVQVEIISGSAVGDRAWPEQAFVECSGPELFSASGIKYGRSCQSGYFTFSEAILLNYKFYDAQYPALTWRDLDASVRHFVRALALADNTNTQQ